MFDAQKSPAAPAIGLPLAPHRQAREAGELVIYHGTFKDREGNSLVLFIFQHIETIWNHACFQKASSGQGRVKICQDFVIFHQILTICW